MKPYARFLLPAAIVLASSLAHAGSDNFETATAFDFPPDVNYVNVSNAAATVQAGEQPHKPLQQDGPFRSLWWKLKATKSGFATFSTVGSNYDTILAVYTGTSLKNLVRLTAADDATTTRAALSFGIKAGASYYLAVDSYSNTGGNTTLASTAFIPFETRTYQMAVPYEGFESSGTLSLTTSNTGAVSGMLRLGAKSYPFKSVMDVTGRVVAWIALANPSTLTALPPFKLDVTLLNQGERFEGTYSYKGADGDEEESETAILRPAGRYTKAAPHPRPGPYNFSTQSALTAGGYTFANLNISATGVCVAKGFLGDGTPFSLTGSYLETADPLVGYFVGRQVLFGGKGHVTTSLRFTAAVNSVSITGTLRSFRPRKATSVLLPNGYASAHSVIGNRYFPPAPNERFFTPFDANGGLTVVNATDGTNILPPVTMALSLTNLFSPADVNPARVTLKVNVKTGLVTGTAQVAPIPAKLATLKGVPIFPTTPGVYGFSSGVTRYGAMTIVPQ